MRVWSNGGERKRVRNLGHSVTPAAFSGILTPACGSGVLTKPMETDWCPIKMDLPVQIPSKSYFTTLTTPQVDTEAQA